MPIEEQQATQGTLIILYDGDWESIIRFTNMEVQDETEQSMGGDGDKRLT